MPSTGRRHRAFSTCASHLIVITIFHGSILFLYCVPSSRSSWLMVKVASVFYTVVIPMLNPLIYSLRNKDVKETARKLVNTKLLCQQMQNGLSLLFHFQEHCRELSKFSSIFNSISNSNFQEGKQCTHLT